MPPYIVYGDCNERKGIKEEEEKCASLRKIIVKTCRGALRATEGKNKPGRIKEPDGAARVHHQGNKKEGWKGGGEGCSCSYTVVLFHAPFRAENYSGARDSLWKCILNGSERTANDTRATVLSILYSPSTIYMSLLLDSVSPFLIILLATYHVLSQYLSLTFLLYYTTFSLSLASTIQYIYTCTYVFIHYKKYDSSSRSFYNKTNVEIAAFVKIWKCCLLQYFVNCNCIM